MTDKPWYSKGLRFECQRCGRCCTRHGEHSFVYLSETEATAIAGHLGLTDLEFRERYCEVVEGWLTLRTDSPACPFLGEGNTCKVYEVRPVQCSTWPFWTENLKRAEWEGPLAELCPGVGKGPLHPQAEIDARVQANEVWQDELD